jgi:cyclopropane-fatty-acyl-phospholipid synthase
MRRNSAARRSPASRLSQEQLAAAGARERELHRHDMMVFQIQLAKRQGVVPTTRDYITQAEACLRGLEHRRRAPLRLAGE